jgi:hypothetical protein
MQNNITTLTQKHIDGIKSPGLFYGKMGVAIFLYHLFNKTGDKQHEEIADNLIDELFIMGYVIMTRAFD